MAVAVPSREEGAVDPSPATAAETAALRADDALARLGYRRLATVPFMLGGFIFGALVTRLLVRAGQATPQARDVGSPVP